MARIEIVGKGRGKQGESNRMIADAVSVELEKLVKLESARNKVDLEADKGALMRAMTQAMGRPELLREAARLARLRLEAEGKIAKEDPAVVKHPGKII